MVEAALAMVLMGAAASVPSAPVAGAQPTVDDASSCGWEQPVEAPVIDGFRPPEHRYGAGNRGLEYDTVVGQAVSSVAPGRVSFVGPVGGRRYVVVVHEIGPRSTYGPLASTSVVRGQQVDSGTELGTALPGLHLTARLDERYVDPAPLLAGVCGRPHLVPGPTPDR